MTQILKQSTAVDVLIGPFVDRTDGFTSETGESPSVKLSKNGQALAAKNDVTTPVSDADGYYNCELDATDTGTVGTLVLTVAASANALPVRHEFMVIEEAIYDALYATSANVFEGAAGSNAVRLVTTTTTNTDMVGTDNAALASELAKVPKSDGTSSWNATALGAINSEVDTALTDIHLDHLLAVDYDPAAKPGTATALLNELIENNGGVSRLTAAALDQAWSVATRILTASTNFNDISTAEVNTEVVDVLKTDTLTATPQAAPPTTPTFEEAVMVLYDALVHAVDVTATSKTFKNNAGTVIWKKAVSDNGTTYTEAEGATGP